VSDLLKTNQNQIKRNQIWLFLAIYQEHHWNPYKIFDDFPLTVQNPNEIHGFPDLVSKTFKNACLS